jgi:hypothetical protein
MQRVYYPREYYDQRLRPPPKEDDRRVLYRGKDGILRYALGVGSLFRKFKEEKKKIEEMTDDMKEEVEIA